MSRREVIEAEPTRDVRWVDAPPIWWVVDDELQKRERSGWRVAQRPPTTVAPTTAPQDHRVSRPPTHYRHPLRRPVGRVPSQMPLPRYRRIPVPVPGPQHVAYAARHSAPHIYRYRRVQHRSLLDQIFLSSMIIPTVLLSTATSVGGGMLSMFVTYGLAGLGLAASGVVSTYYLVVMMIVSSIGFTLKTGQRRILGNLLLTVAMVSATMSVFLFFLLMGAVGATVWMDLQG